MPLRRETGTPTDPARGFTLIDLVIVVLIAGLLAGIAAPRLDHARERSQLTRMEAGLRAFAGAQASYHYDFGIYAADPALLEGRGFAVDSGLSITVNEATSSGWSATARHAGTSAACHLFVGTAAPVGAATAAGTIGCG